MEQLRKVGLLVGLASLVIAVISRVTLTPVLGVESEAIVKFAATCFLLSIASSLSVCKK